MSVELTVRLRDEVGTAEGTRAANQLLNALFDEPQAITFASRVGRSETATGIECVLIDDDCMVTTDIVGMGYDLVPGETGEWWVTVDAGVRRNGRSLLLAVVLAAALAHRGSALVIDEAGILGRGHLLTADQLTGYIEELGGGRSFEQTAALLQRAHWSER